MTTPTPTPSDAEAAKALRKHYERAYSFKTADEFYAAIEHAERETASALTAAREAGKAEILARVETVLAELQKADAYARSSAAKKETP